MNIVFYNPYHNGDIFASKAYIEDIANEFKDATIYYQHFNSPRLLRDVNVQYRTLEAPLGEFDNRTTLHTVKDTMYINTWIGNYLHLGDGLNWPTYHKMFKEIYRFIFDETDKEIALGPVEYYIPEIRYEYFDIPDVTIPENTVIISNGRCLSGQSDIDTIDSLIPAILDNTDCNIILTHFANVNSDRVFYTNTLTERVGNDLNEISWIASQCKYIIGRNSGPFCFMNTKSILNDPDKTVISIGNKEEDAFPYGIGVRSNYKFLSDTYGGLEERVLRAMK